MFRRFQGLIQEKFNNYMRFIVMQKTSPAKYAPAEYVRRSLLASGLIVATLGAVSAPVLAGATGAANETGLWYDDSGDGAVKIEPCGNNLCGKIVWLKEPLNAKGEPLFDRHNPDASKQKRSICGLQILGELKPQPNGGFDGGWVYDPKEGKSYSLAIQLTGKDQLSITGYLGVKLLGRTMIWTRAKTELPSCSTTAAATSPGAKPVTTGTAAAAGAAAPAGAVKTKNAGAGEGLPWADAKPAAQAVPAKPAAAKPVAVKPAAPSSQLGASGVNPAVKKAKPAAPVTQQRPETAAQ
jgi:uncharacterized protein (DUF2147 family)